MKQKRWGYVNTKCKSASPSPEINLPENAPVGQKGETLSCEVDGFLENAVRLRISSQLIESFVLRVRLLVRACKKVAEKWCPKLAFSRDLIYLEYGGVRALCGEIKIFVVSHRKLCTTSCCLCLQRSCRKMVPKARLVAIWFINRIWRRARLVPLLSCVCRSCGDEPIPTTSIVYIPDRCHGRTWYLYQGKGLNSSLGILTQYSLGYYQYLVCF